MTTKTLKFLGNLDVELFAPPYSITTATTSAFFQAGSFTPATWSTGSSLGMAFNNKPALQFCPNTNPLYVYTPNQVFPFSTSTNGNTTSTTANPGGYIIIKNQIIFVAWVSPFNILNFGSVNNLFSSYKPPYIPTVPFIAGASSWNLLNMVLTVQYTDEFGGNQIGLFNTFAPSGSSQTVLPLIYDLSNPFGARLFVANILLPGYLIQNCPQAAAPIGQDQNGLIRFNQTNKTFFGYTRIKFNIDSPPPPINYSPLTSVNLRYEIFEDVTNVLFDNPTLNAGIAASNFSISSNSCGFIFDMGALGRYLIDPTCTYYMKLNISTRVPGMTIPAISSAIGAIKISIDGILYMFGSNIASPSLPTRLLTSFGMKIPWFTFNVPQIPPQDMECYSPCLGKDSIITRT